MQFKTQTTINKRKKTKRLRFNVNRLMDTKISKLYSSKLDEKFNNLNINYCNPTDIYTKFEQVIIITSSEIKGNYRSKIPPWITDDIFDLCD